MINNAKLKNIVTCLSLVVCINFFPRVTVAGELEVSGITEPCKDSTLSSNVAGVISAILRKEGEFVKQGEVILELENEQETLEVARRKIISDSKVELNAAAQRTKTLKDDYDNTRRVLEATASVSQEELDKKELEYKLAKAEFDGLRIAEDRELIEYEIAKAQLDKRKITAPFDGVMVKIFLRIGEGCSAQQPLARIVDTRQCRFITHMDAAASKNLKKGNKAVLKLTGNNPETVLQGVIEYVSAVVDPSSSLREVKVLFDNPNGEVSAGISATMNSAGD